ncbi:HAMP domain-containing sensor histidine kinase [uncultured Propionivibrio sp.]|uniref:HAMP domain-containing sensor histidine kinase n=1 Tax=uncultured Propionivibrio sp. TaxID=426737 RepID=UPI0029BFCAB6|nr:HAMP domain-containing sensor histidine kinase [uncultured Propionivibrio sp.]
MRFKLNFLLVALVTAVLLVSSIFSVFALRHQLEQRFDQRKQEIASKLRANLAQALWNFDKQQAERVIDAELASQDVLAIRVIDERGRLFLEHARKNAADIAEKDLVSARLEWSGDGAGEALALGQVEIDFSREYLERVMFEVIRARLIEIVVLNALLGVMLYAAMSRIVIRPLLDLSKAFRELASEDHVSELKLRGEDEFGEVVDAYNRIERRLVSDIERRSAVEQELLRTNRELSATLDTLKQAQDTLVQSEKFASLGELVAGVAHEINTPVGVALTGASCLQEETRRMQVWLDQGVIRKSDLAQFVARVDEGAQLVMSNVERAAHLIQSFKQVSVDASSDERRQFRLGDYLDEVLTSLRPKFRHRRVRVTCACPRDVEMNSCPGLLAQVVTNLVLNALMHGYDEDGAGEIALDVRDEGDWVEMICRNDGHPIPVEHLPRIFDPFFTTRRGRGGTGLGLNIVANIVTHRLGGTIRVSSAPGETAFVVRLPKVLPTPVPEALVG